MPTLSPPHQRMGSIVYWRDRCTPMPGTRLRPPPTPQEKASEYRGAVKPFVDPFSSKISRPSSAPITHMSQVCVCSDVYHSFKRGWQAGRERRGGLLSGGWGGREGVTRIVSNHALLLYLHVSCVGLWAGWGMARLWLVWYGRSRAVGWVGHGWVA